MFLQSFRFRSRQLGGPGLIPEHQGETPPVLPSAGLANSSEAAISPGRVGFRTGGFSYATAITTLTAPMPLLSKPWMASTKCVWRAGLVAYVTHPALSRLDAPSPCRFPSSLKAERLIAPPWHCVWRAGFLRM